MNSLLSTHQEFKNWTFPADMRPAFILNDLWIETSWHNDTMPSFEAPTLGLKLWIDFQQSSSEVGDFADWTQYQLLPYDSIEQVHPVARALYAGDCWELVEQAIKSRSLIMESIKSFADLATSLEWGTSLQVDSENRFFALVQGSFDFDPEEHSYLIKATTLEMIEYTYKEIGVEWDKPEPTTPFMSLHAFRETRTHTTATKIDGFEDLAGVEYCNGQLFIESKGEQGGFDLVIANTCKSGKLSHLERDLYRYAIAEGVIRGNLTECISSNEILAAIDSATDALFASIQDRINVTDGGLASMWWGDNKEEIQQFLLVKMGQYVACEDDHANR